MITGLISIALLLSAILSWHFLKGGSIIGCTGGSSCDEVLNSQWSMIAGVLPVSGLAMGVYLAMLFATFYIGPSSELSIRRLAWKVLLIMSGTIAGSAIWFTIVQKWIVGEFCVYCMTTHLTGLLLAVLIIWRANKELNASSKENKLQDTMEGNSVVKNRAKPVLRPFNTIGLTIVGLLFAGIMVTSQFFLASSSIYVDGESNENLPVAEYDNAPVIGSANAPYIVSLLFDYQCSHCQKIHFMLNEVVLRYNGKLAFVLCPAPLNTKCNPYIPRDVEAFKNSCELVRISMTVWLAGREAFTEFDNWMFTYESGDRWRPRTIEAVREKALELVGQSAFNAAWSDPWVERYIQSSVKLFGQTLQGGKGGIPKLIYDSRWVIPETNNVDDLIRIMQESLGIPKP